MATCTVSGNFVTPLGAAIVGATVRFNIDNPCLDASGNAIMPQESTTTTGAGGAWSLAITQGVSGSLTLDLNPTTTSAVVKYQFSLVIPSASSATFASCWADSSTFSGSSSGFPVYFTSIAGQLAVTQLPVLADGYIWVGQSGTATPVMVSGDATLLDTGALTLATVNAAPGTIGSATTVPVVTVNAKGLATSVTSTPIQITESQVTGLVAALAGLQPAGTYVTAVAVNSTNGFTGSSSGGATPALTLGTSITGILKGNGTSVSAAAAGTDYVTPSGSLAANTGLPLTTGVTGVLPLAYGGTNANLTAAAGAIPYSTGSAIALLAPGSSGNVLTSGGAGAPTWSSPLTNPMTTLGDIIVGGSAGAANRLAGNTTTTPEVLMQTGTGSASNTPAWTAFTAPTVQKFTATGTTTGYLFTVTSANATVGATYTNNGNTYTVLATIAAATQLFTSQSSAPTASGTLTKASGTGDATITFSAKVALATYTTPISPRVPVYLRIQGVGGGGGGGGGGSSPGAGGAGGVTTFGAGMLVMNGGSGGVNGAGQDGGAGGTASLGTGPIGIALSGGSGGGGSGSASFSGFIAGGMGAVSPFGGSSGSAGNAAIANSGSGGAGGISDVNLNSGSGGGAGGFVNALVASPGTSFFYCIGAGGTGGSGSHGGSAGATGGLVVEEYYQ
jgi:hypothetical protein